MSPKKRDHNYDYKPDFEENPSFDDKPGDEKPGSADDSEVDGPPFAPPEFGDPQFDDGEFDDDAYEDTDLAEYRDLDEGETPSGPFAPRTQAGCGIVITIAIVLGISLPLFFTFFAGGGDGGGDGGGNSASRDACNLHRSLYDSLAINVPEVPYTDAEVVEFVREIANEAADADSQIRDNSAALLAAIDAGDVEQYRLSFGDLAEACVTLGY